MTANHFQFQPGLTLSEFLQDYGTQSQCGAAVEKTHWPEGYRCPYCQSGSYCIVWHGQVKTFQYNRCHNAGYPHRRDHLSRQQTIPC